MARRQSEGLAYGLAGLGMVGIVILAAVSRPVPEPLWLIEIAVVGGALGITAPRR